MGGRKREGDTLVKGESMSRVQQPLCTRWKYPIGPLRAREVPSSGVFAQTTPRFKYVSECTSLPSGKPSSLSKEVLYTRTTRHRSMFPRLKLRLDADEIVSKPLCGLLVVDVGEITFRIGVREGLNGIEIQSSLTE